MATLLATTRRDFLRTTSAVIVGFAMDAALPRWTQATAGRPSQTAGEPIGKPLDPHQVDSFLAFHADGSVTIYTSKVDVGTGLRIAMSQVVAEELEIPIERISIIEGDTALVPNHGGTGGSSGVPRGAVEVRQAAATARQSILRLAADQLQRPVANLTLAQGEVRSTGGQSITIASLIGDKRLAVQVDPKAPLKDPSRYTVVGKPILRPDVPGKCTGRHTYVQDFSVPGMLHARVIRPAAMGAKLVSVDESSIKSIPDVRVIRMDSFLAVVSSDEWAAVRASRELKAEWSDWQGLPGSDGLDQFVRASAIERDKPS